MLQKTEQITISPPRFETIQVIIRGIAPLVIERFSKKAELMMKMAEGKSSSSKKTRKARDYDAEAEDARYRSEEGWEGVNVAAFRAACISACRLIGFKMTIAKLSLFVEADGYDKNDGIPMIRVYGESRTFTQHTRNATGVVDVRSRPQYRDWTCRLRIKFDRDQLSPEGVINLISRAGQQVGIGAGRPDSKQSAGCGWGTFEIASSDDEKTVMETFGMAR